jgi:CheY-like chemotaxis protein
LPAADDHGLNLRLCRRLLETAGGLQVVTADDGDVALRALIDSYNTPQGGEPVDIVLMDMQARLTAARAHVPRQRACPSARRRERDAPAWRR